MSITAREPMRPRSGLRKFRLRRGRQSQPTVALGQVIGRWTVVDLQSQTPNGPYCLLQSGDTFRSAPVAEVAR